MSGMAITKWLAISMVLIQVAFSCLASAACEQVKISAPDANADDRFGVSVAIDGYIAVIGAHQNDSNGSDSGAVYVYLFSGSAWIQRQKLVPSDASPGDQFGRSVAIEGDTIVVGSYLDDNTGSAYVFKRSDMLWTEQQKLTAPDACAGDRFGASVAVFGDTILVGAYGDDTYTGAAYVFRIGSPGNLQQKLIASDADKFDYFGYSVAIDNNVIIVGAYKSNHSGIDDAGSAYVFTFDGWTWTQDAVLHAPDPNSSDHFGSSIALDGNCAVIGAYECDINLVSDVGAVYVFERTDPGVLLSQDSSGGWIQRQKLFDSTNPNVSDDFGRAVAIEGDTILVGCVYYHVDDKPAGAVFEFAREGQTWLQRSLLTADDANTGDNFGFSVAMSGRRLIAGAHYSDGNGPSSGSAYIFTHPAGDLDRNCSVDFADFAVLAASWLQNDPLRDIAPPPAGDGIVDIYDLTVLCEHWLDGN